MAIVVPVAIKPATDSDPVVYGKFLGLLSNNQGCDRCDGDGYSAVVQLDGHGMIVKLYHPSRVVLLDQSLRALAEGQSV